MDFSPYFQKKLGEHLKIARIVTHKDSLENIFRLFDLEVIAVDDHGVLFQVWSFSYADFIDEAEYNYGQNHGVSFADFSRCASVEDLLFKATAKYIDVDGLLKKGSYVHPFLAHR